MKLLSALVVAVAAGITVAPHVRAEGGPAEAMFQRMSRLAGDWNGTFEWSGARKDSGSLQARYYLTGNGSALVEDLVMGDVPSMTSVYHLDGSDLRMTHYCGARNQPRLKASKVDAERGTAEFAFVDVTNVGPKNSAHVQACEVRILDPDRIHIKFVFGGAGKAQAIEDISLQRVKSES